MSCRGKEIRNIETEFLPNESCYMMECERTVFLHGYCGNHLHKYRLHELSQMIQTVNRSREAVLIYAQLLANRQLTLIR